MAVEQEQSLPGNQYVSNRGSFDWSISAKSKAGLAVDVLRVANIGAIIAFIDGHVYPRSFRVRLNIVETGKERGITTFHLIKEGFCIKLKTRLKTRL